MNHPARYLGILCMLFSTTLFAQKTETYSRVKVLASKDKQIKLMQRGIPFEELAEKNSNYVVGDFSASDIAIMKAEGIKVQYLIDDISADFVKRNTASFKEALRIANTTSVPPGFNYGSMGGYLTLSEIEKELDSLKLNYPSLITTKVSIGSSLEGRPIWMVKISDNPDVDENEPKVFLNGLIHAREPVSMTNLIYFMQFILTNYNSDPELQCLINNRQIYVVPCTNPDGYAHNQTTNPNGGGMWRKNRRNNGDGTFGVDLNRNFGFNWGYDNTGSSPTTSSDSYRGTAGFSEPETQVIRDFCLAHQFGNVINHHSYANTFNTPWGYINQATPDNTHFMRWGNDACAENGYAVGTSYQNLGYVLNGGANDWMYGEQVLKNKIFAAVMESGSSSDGFWPVQSRIIPLNQAALLTNIKTCWAAGDYFVPSIAQGLSFNGAAANLPVTVTNIGLQAGTVESVTFSTADARVSSVGAPVSLAGLGIDGVLNSSITINFVTNAAAGAVNGDLVVTTKQGCTIKYPVTFNYDGICNPLLSGWTGGNVGSVGIAGSVCYNNGVYTVKGSGTGMTSNSDQYYLVRTATSGNYTIKARINSIQNTAAGAKAGIVITESTATGSRRVSLCVIPSTGRIEFQSRKSTGAKVSTTSNATGTAPKWLRLVRNASTFTASYSNDGVNWTTYTSANISMSSSAFAGLAVTSGTNSTLNTAVFDNVTAGAGTNLRTGETEITASQIKEGYFGVYPNPGSASQLIFQYNAISAVDNAQMIITDMTGREVQRQTIRINKGVNNFTIQNAASIKPGVYIVQLKAGTLLQKAKVVITK
ncbi:MAG TPA: M14 family zinc carboxypeptidase [Lacibacter sp.]|nr:M14 family zinc carboxypeptidase [Lacibacter sp.]